ncbi:NIL domain-containing protein [Helicobacter pylori]|nr:NIL domain-containing protein [Helicobacter pylori]
MIRRFKIDVSIISGNIEELTTKDIGYLVVRFLGSVAETQRALEYLNALGLQVEKLKD